MIKKILFAFAAIILLVVLAAAVGLLVILSNFGVSPQLAYRVLHEEHKDITAIANAEGPIETPYGIAERGFVKIGGIDQWVTIRGEDRRNPAILILHGGPGDTQSQLAYIYRHWEKPFTIIQWDQRGTGRTYGRNGDSTPNMTFDQFIEDGAEVAAYARQRLGQDRIILFGHSWGSALGVYLLKRHPDLFSAFVGTGQISDSRAQTRWQYDYTLKRLAADGQISAAQELRKLGPPPYATDAQEEVMRKYLNRYLADSDKEYLVASVSLALYNKSYSMKDLADHQKGYLSFALPKMYKAYQGLDFSRLGYDMPVPFFIIDGREDHLTPPDLVVDYFNKINAPQKAMILIEHAGHFAAMTKSDEFLQILVSRVRPLANATASGG
ncbi:MAG: alpha/beta fold hydrolase [Alphaproteobacteria bacterium]